MALRGSSITERQSAGRSAPPSSAAASPPASRRSRARWRDPRLVVGVALVALCALLGARLLGGADATVGVWAARGALNEGQQVGTADLVRRQVRFDDQAAADRYLSADDELPADAVVNREVGAGELLPRAAVGGSETGPLTEVPLSVRTEAVPSTVRVGSTVDVWVTPDSPTSGAKAGAAPARRSTLVFDDVAVVSAPRATTSLGPSATRQVIVGVTDARASRLPTAIAALAGGDVVLTVQR